MINEISYKRKLFLSLAFGLLGLLLSPLGLSISYGEVIINLPWSIVFPLMIAIAFGPRFGFIAAIAGSAFYPFLLWPQEGYANIASSLILISLFTSLGVLGKVAMKNNYPQTLINLSLILLVNILFLSGIYIYLFNPILSLNPPFWYSATHNIIDKDILISFAIKDAINFVLLALLAEIILRLPLVRSLFGIISYPKMRLNHRVFLASVSASIVISLVLIILNSALFKGGISANLQFLNVVIYVVLWSGVFVSRIVIIFSEKRLEGENELQKAFTQIKEEQENIKALINVLPDLIFIVDRNYVFLNNYLYNTKDRNLLATDYLGKKITEILPADVSKESIKRLDLLFSTREKQILQFNLDLNKEQKNFEATFILKSNTTALIVVRDITDQKIAENKIIQLSRAVEQSPSSVIITDLNGNIEYINPKLSEITGYTLEEVIGKNPRIFSSGEMSKEQYKILWNDITSGKEWLGELHNKKKNGELYWEYASISPIKDEDQNIAKFLAIKDDITKDKQIEEQLKLSLKKAEQSDELKTNLLSNMSHELRTPMNGILGMASILKSELIDEQQQLMVEQIIRSGNRLMVTLNSVLTLAQLDANGDELRKNSFSVKQKIDKIHSEFKERAEGKNLTFTLDSIDEKLLIFGNEILFEQILSYLVDNAIKFTVSGGLYIYFNIFKQNDSNFILINVKDSGIGISSDDCQLIFNEFHQVSKGYSRRYEGLGLGLTLVNKVCSIMGWHLSVDSKLNEGSTFSIRIPLLDAKVDENNKVDDISFKENPSLNFDEGKFKPIKKLLYVEDNEINSYVLEKYLSKDNFQYSNAKNGQEALSKLSENHYDLILMDINLGIGMDGVELSKEIRKIKEYENVPIIAVTGYAMGNDAQNLMAEGLTDYLAKPFKKDELLSKLEQYN